MPKRPARIYRTPKHRLYTRKEYMRGTPVSKITIFDMGINDEFGIEMSLYAKEPGQITHNALEASRIAANRFLVKKTGRAGFHLKVRLYPHVILRENKQATGAGADRFSDGMSKAFGRPVSLATTVKKGQKIMTLKINPSNFEIGKQSLTRAAAKIPMPCGISLDKGKELLK
jgi:large subunit ribosomal protein L10e